MIYFHKVSHDVKCLSGHGNVSQDMVKSSMDMVNVLNDMVHVTDIPLRSQP
jgi:hypothetical protein